MHPYLAPPAQKRVSVPPSISPTPSALSDNICLLPALSLHSIHLSHPSNAAAYVSMVTVHWYKATKETPNTPQSLLEEGPVRAEMDNLRQLVQVANSFGKPLRVAEANTISNSGRLGVSNVFAGEGGGKRCHHGAVPWGGSMRLTHAACHEACPDAHDARPLAGENRAGQ
jgi:hypothetical protein